MRGWRRGCFRPSTALAEIKARRPQPDWRTIHRELRRKGVTLQLLWEEHRAAHPNGYGYSRYVAAKIMLCKGRQARNHSTVAGNPHHIIRSYSAFRKVIREGVALA